MKNFCFLLLFSVSLQSSVFAEESSDLKVQFNPEPVSLEAGLDAALSDSIEHMVPEHRKPMPPERNTRQGPFKTPGPDQAYAHAVLVKEIPNTLVVVFNYSTFMNVALLRASIFAENLKALMGEQPIVTAGGPIIQNRHLMRGELFFAAGGHDLKGRDLLKFWDAFDQSASNRLRPVRDIGLRALMGIEKEFRSFLEPLVRKNPDMTVIAVATDSTIISLLSHELYHAQFFNHPEFRASVERFWDEKVSAEDKVKIMQTLGDPANGVGYDTSNRELMINEFLAYTLMLQANWMMLAPFLDPYHHQLRSYLEAQFPDMKRVRLPNPHGAYVNEYCVSFLLLQD